MDKLDLHFNSEVVESYVNNLADSGSLSNFLEQCVSTLLKGGVLAEIGKDITISDNDNSFFDNDLDNLLESEESLGEGVNEIDENIDEGLNTNEEVDIFGDLDDVEDEENDFDVPIPVEVVQPTKEETSTAEEPSKGETLAECDSDVDVLDKEFMIDIRNKLDKLLSLAESGGFSGNKGSRMAPLDLNIKPKEQEQTTVDIVEDESSDEDSNVSVSNLLGGLDIGRIIEINNKLSGR